MPSCTRHKMIGHLLVEYSLQVLFKMFRETQMQVEIITDSQSPPDIHIIYTGPQGIHTVFQTEMDIAMENCRTQKINLIVSIVYY